MKKYDDDYVAVRMLPSADGRKAKTLLNPYGDRLIAFFRTVYIGKNPPREGEVWICRLIEETTGEGGQGGALSVDPIRRVSNEAGELFTALGKRKKLRDADGTPIRVSRRLAQECLCRPEIAAVLRGAIASIRVKLIPAHGRARGLHLPLPEPFAVQDIVATDPIGLDDPALFAFRHGMNAPIRVVQLANPPVTSDLYLSFIEKEDGEWILSWANTGGRFTPGEPTDRRHEDNDEVLNFWLKHAHVYDAKYMKPPFNSSWSEVLEPTFEATEPSETRLPEHRDTLMELDNLDKKHRS